MYSKLEFFCQLFVRPQRVRECG